MSPVQVGNYQPSLAETRAIYALGINCDNELANFVIKSFDLGQALI